MRKNMSSLKTATRILSVIFIFVAFSFAAITFSGCSAGQKGLLQITPEQYFYSAKEKLETIDERNYEIRDLDEIIRVLENAEKDAKKAEIIDKSRMYLLLANILKARKLYQTSLMKGEYIANRAEPFFVVNTKEVKETLRTAGKWLRTCNAQFKTTSLIPDLNFVRGLYHSMKMLTQHSREKRESLESAVDFYRRCYGMSPAYKSDFRLFGRFQTTREVRLKMIETLALGGQQADAYGLLNEFTFAAISPVSGSTDYQDFAWHHMRGFVLAMMGRYNEASEALEKFKIVFPQDYPLVDEALWILEGIYDKLGDQDDKFKMEAKIVAALQKKLKGPYSKEQYSTAAHLFPRVLAGDQSFYEAVCLFYDGKFAAAEGILQSLKGRGVMSSNNRYQSRLMAVESLMYSGSRISDDLLEEIIVLAENSELSPLQKERAGYLLARYVMDDDQKFDKSKVNHDGQSFIKSITGKPWAIKLQYKRGELKKATRPVSKRTGMESEDEEAKREPGRLVAELYANKVEDWVVSANLYLISLPDLSLLGDGRVVGRENEQEGWIFKDDQVDKIKRRKNYLAVFEYDNSDSEKSLQGVILRP